MIAVKINASKVAKEHLYEGKNGKYLDVILFENKDGQDQYGNDGFVVQSVSKEAKDRGEKGPILGNWKRLQTKTRQPEKTKPTSLPIPADEDDVPF